MGAASDARPGGGVAGRGGSSEGVLGAWVLAVGLLGFWSCWYASALHAGVLPQSGWLRPPATWLAPDPYFAVSPKSRAASDGADSLCAMTHMRPQFIPMAVPPEALPTDGLRDKVAAGRYSLMRYVDHNAAGTAPRREGDYALGDIPALFVPGNAGSGKQVRSLATESFRRHASSASSSERGGRSGGFLIDFYAVDFDEELSAFHGGYLVDHADFVAAALGHVLSGYPSGEGGKKFLLIGHSMGGVVARLALAVAPAPVPNAICLALVTLASPHADAPAHVHPSLEAAYARLVNVPLPQGIALVSLSGGGQDYQVHPWLTRMWRGYHPEAIAEFSSRLVEEDAPAMPGAWIPATHQGILWCNQVVTTLARGLNAAVEARDGGTGRVAEVLRAHLVSNLPRALALEPWPALPWSWVVREGDPPGSLEAGSDGAGGELSRPPLLPYRCDDAPERRARRMEVLGISGYDNGGGNATLLADAWQSWGWDTGSKAERLSLLGLSVVTNLEPGTSLLLSACTLEGDAVDVTGVVTPLPAPEARPLEGGLEGDVPRGGAGFRTWAREHEGLDRGRMDTPPLYVAILDVRALEAAVGKAIVSVEVTARSGSDRSVSAHKRRAPAGGGVESMSGGGTGDLLWAQPSFARVPDPDFPDWESPSSLFFAKLVGQYHFKQAPGHAAVARFPVHSFVYEGPWRGWAFAVRVSPLEQKQGPVNCFAPLLHALDRVGGEELVFPDVGGSRHALSRGGWTTVSFHAPFDSLGTAPLLTLISDPRCAYAVDMDWTRESSLEALATFWLAHRIGPKSMAAGFGWLTMALALPCGGMAASGAVGALTSAASRPFAVWLPLVASAVLAHAFVGGAMSIVALGLGFAGTFAVALDTLAASTHILVPRGRDHLFRRVLSGKGDLQSETAASGRDWATSGAVLCTGGILFGVIGAARAEAVGVFVACLVQGAAGVRRVPLAVSSALALLALWPALFPSVAVLRSPPTLEAQASLAHEGHALLLRLASPVAPWLIASAGAASASQVRSDAPSDKGEGAVPPLPIRALLFSLACASVHAGDWSHRLVPAAALACLLRLASFAGTPRSRKGPPIPKEKVL